LIENNFTLVLDYLISIENSLKKFVTMTNPNLLIAHQLKIGDALLLGSIFKKQNIPVSLISHGSHPYNNDDLANFELLDNLEGLLLSRFASSSVIQSKVALDAVKKRNFKKLSINLILSQPLMWGHKDNFIKKKNKQKFTILHAGTPKPLGTRPLIYETSFEYYRSIEFLSKTVSKLKNFELIIRFRPAKELNVKSFLKLMPKYKNVKIKFDGNFYEDLQQSDMLVSFASTTIEESLYSYKPVGLLGLDNRYWHLKGSKNIPSSKKRNSVYYLNKENLKSMLISIKKFHHNKPLNYSELKKYIWQKNTPGLKEFVSNQLSR
jgi:hypothetical protein